MNPIDETILKGQFPGKPTEDELVTEFKPGESYYWDARARGLTHEQAVVQAALEMGSALASLHGMRR
jgi:hypothetical protein